MKRILIISLLFILATAGSFVLYMWIFDNSGEPASFIKHELNSSLLDEKREVIVKLPETYNASTTYPTVYVIGGNSLTFNLAYELDVLSKTGFFEEAIVVGIPNPSQKTRQRDLTPPGMKQDLDESDSPEGKADTYLEFIKTEVVSLIESNYSVNQTRIGVGHSRAGMTVIYSLIKEPTLFKGHVALSPALWRENNIFVDIFRDQINSISSNTPYLFMSLGTDENQKMKGGLNAFINVLEQTKPLQLQWKYHPTQGANHQTNPYVSGTLGFKALLTME